ncbi:TonB family protein / TonB-dependent receptor [Minicystis rosea]|nr:TonB family protein / TonB-dependent receptor [Minicystis rosea]
MRMRSFGHKGLGRAAALALSLVALAPAKPAFAQGAAPGAQKQPKLTKLPKLLKFVEAAYPEEEKKTGRAASVTVEIAISETGAVVDAAVVGSAGAAFDAAALAAVKQFVFEPAEFDNKPAPVKITYRYDFVLKEEPKGPVVNFEGVVKNRFTKKPMAGAVVTIDGKLKATTDAEGHFSFTDVPIGKHSVEIAGPGVTPVTTEETIEEKKKLDAKYTVEPKEEEKAEDAADVEVVVVVPKVQKEVVSTQIVASEGRRVPGTQGDTLKVVQNLPGVARAATGSGALVVWGAAPQDTRVYVDGVRIPLLYHGGGVRATVNSDMVRSIDLIPGGYGPEYGRGIGGLVTIETRAPKTDGIHGYASADVADASAMLEGPIGSKTSFMVSARKSYLDRVISLTTKKDVSVLFPIPNYYDGQVRLVRQLRDNESLELFAFGSSDRLTRSVDSADPTQVKSERTGFDFGRVVLKYRYQMPDGATLWVTPSVGRDVSTLESNFGGAPSTLDIKTNIFGLRAGWRGRVGPNMVVTAGLDVEASLADLARSGAVASPPREGDIHVFGQPAPDKVSADTWKTTQLTVAPYAQLDWSLAGDKLHIIPGFRFEPYLVAGSRKTPIVGDTPSIGFAREETAIEPRLSVRFNPVKPLMLKAAWGIYHQAPLSQDLSAYFGNPLLGASVAHHVLGGASYNITDTLMVEAVGFFSRSVGLASRSDAPSPLLAQALVDEGEGRAFGGQILVRQSLAKGFFGWASYSLIRSERRDHPDRAWRLFDNDQTHVLTVVASYEPGLGFEFGARFRYASGFPRTAVLGAFYDSRRDIYEPYFDKTNPNQVRIPAFVQLDVRAAKRFDFGRVKAEIYLDVQNVTNKKNAEDLIYSYDYKKQSTITGLPILPVFGGRLDF